MNLIHCNPALLARDAFERDARAWAATPEPVRETLRELYAAVERDRVARSHRLAQRRTLRNGKARV